ncbi:TraK family protein [Nitrosomonas ureae]|uniref:Uncharacterized protein n=1 Tax=Nitrosomonas ureae TaxID=44577 RepID=A0A1H9GAL4_9PROT|nr:TraK family protein [Nitrosomonas ureae]PTQ78930.1 hypothetical protein C8R28_10625 [Nitrosomonas ureae]SEQ47161.1 hypothetical protein SAMN05421510_10599 [Nitrosomonas ureae]
MNPSLSERISLREQKNPGRRNLYEPAFLALKTEISQALHDGWSMRQIWSTLKDEKKIGCSYLWFRNLVKRHIFAKPDDLSARKKHGQPVAGISREPDNHGFNYRSSIDKEELI